MPASLAASGAGALQDTSTMCYCFCTAAAAARLPGQYCISVVIAGLGCHLGLVSSTDHPSAAAAGAPPLRRSSSILAPHPPTMPARARCLRPPSANCSWLQPSTTRRCVHIHKKPPQVCSRSRLRRKATPPPPPSPTQYTHTRPHPACRAPYWLDEASLLRGGASACACR